MLNQLTQDWIDAKYAEQEANKKRLTVEAQILTLYKALLDIVEASDTPKFKELQKALTLSPSKPSFSYKE